MTRLRYQIEVDPAQVADAVSLFEHIGGTADEAVKVAINKTGPKVRTASSRAIRTQVRLTAGYVGERLTFRRATKTKLDGAIQTPSRGLLMTKFSTDPLVSGERVSWIKPPPVPARGIQVKVKPGGAAVVFGPPPGSGAAAFYLVLRGSGALGIAARKRDGGLQVFHGPSLSQVFNTVRDDVLPDAAAEYQAQLLDAIRFLTLKLVPTDA